MINPPPTDTPSLPLWMQITAFVLSLLLGVVKLLDLFRRPKLHVHVTKDLFFRLIDTGEAAFCTAVLLARNGPVLVRSVNVSLKRLNLNKGYIAEKSFPLEVTQFGEKVLGQNVMAEHKFIGSSVFLYLPPAQPYRAVYLCLQAEYKDRQAAAVTGYVQSVEKFKEDHLGVAEDQVEVVRKQFGQLIDKHFGTMVPLIQLEAGDYKLSLTVEYECVGWRFLGKADRVTSSVEFSVRQDSLDQLKADLHKLLRTRGQQILEDKIQDVPYPLLNPTNFKELPR